MHYYSHNVADYRKDTAHLSLLEHGIYRQLLDSYYLDEKPIETQQVIRRLSIKTQEEELALKNVLDDFFTLSECGKYHHHVRCDSEIVKYKGKAETSRTNGSKGGRPKKPKKTQQVNLANPEETQTKGNQEPLTINHKPLKRERFAPPSLDDVFNYMVGQSVRDPAGESERFVNYYESNGWKVGRNGMKSWRAAVKNWMRNIDDFKKPDLPPPKTKTIENLTNTDWASEIIEGDTQ